MAMEYYSFDKVLTELQMEEDELKRLVSEGEIRAFRDEDKMKFKRSDIDGLKKGRMTEPTIILPSSGSGSGSGSASTVQSEEESEVLLVEDDTSETLLDIDDLDESDSGSASSTSVPTIDFSEGVGEDTGSETLTEELVFDDSSSELALDDSSSVVTQDIGTEETFVDDSTGMTTEPLDLMDDSESGDSSSVQATVVRPGASSSTRMGTRAGSGRRTGARPAAALAPPPPPGSPIFTAILVLSGIFLFTSSFMMLNVQAGRDSALTRPLTNWIGSFRPPSFAGDARINPGADSNKIEFSEGEVQWYRQWRDKPHYAVGDRRAKQNP